MSTAVFMGCEAALGALTAGVGAVAGAVACDALAGAVGGLVTQGVKCIGGQKGACSAGSFIKAGVIGGVVRGVAGLGGALGGKLLSAVGGKALSAIGGLFGRGGTDLAEGAAADIGEGAAADTAASVAGGSATSSADNVATSTAQDAGRATPRSGGRPHSEEPNGPRTGRSGNAGDSCRSVPHSFTGGTTVLLAGGATKCIDQVKVGDTVADAAPDASSGETHTVQQVIVTSDDHNFVDLSIAPLSSSLAGPRASAGITTTACGPTTAAASPTTSPSTASTRTMWSPATPRCWYTTAADGSITTARLSGARHMTLAWRQVWDLDGMLQRPMLRVLLRSGGRENFST